MLVAIDPVENLLPVDAVSKINARQIEFMPKDVTATNQFESAPPRKTGPPESQSMSASHIRHALRLQL